MKDHVIREFVNDMFDLAHEHQNKSLRDRMARRTREFLIEAGWLSPYDRDGGEMCWPDALERV